MQCKNKWWLYASDCVYTLLVLVCWAPGKSHPHVRMNVVGNQAAGCVLAFQGHCSYVAALVQLWPAAAAAADLCNGCNELCHRHPARQSIVQCARQLKGCTTEATLVNTAAAVRRTAHK
jgi:hypothetical protein